MGIARPLAEFPGAKLVSDAVAKSGTTPLAPAITFILEKVAPFIPKPAEPEPAAAAEATPREVAVEEEKKEEAAEPAAAASSEVVEEKKEAEEKKEEEKPAEAAVAAPAEEEKKWSLFEHAGKLLKLPWS